MDFRRAIESKLLKKGKSPETMFNEVTFGLIKVGNLSLGDLMEAPIPLVLSMYDELKKYNKAKERAMKKRR